MINQRKRVAKRLASGLMAGALALGGLAISGAGSAGAVPIEEDSDQRIAGTDRYSTSADISATIEDEAGDIETLVVASGENFPDALAAAGLTHNDGATPAAILLVESDSIPAGVLAQMNRIDDTVTQVYVVGGEAAISDDVVADIEDIFGDASVDRIAGDNRYETAIRVADEIGHDGTVILASGTSFADAITVGAWASTNATPILLANADGLPTETEDELSDLIDGGDGVVDRVIIVGGTAAVGSVEEDLVDMGLAPAGVSRVAGANRYATNLQWNVENFSTSFFTPKALTSDESLNLNGVTQLYASGANYPDALAAAPLAAELGAHVILVDPVSVGASALTLATVGKTAITVDNSTLGTQVRAAIFDGAANGDPEDGFFGQNIWVIGGTNAVPTSVMSTIEGASAQSLGCDVILRKANDNDDLTGDGIGPDLAIVSWAGNLQSDEEMTAGEIDIDDVLDGTELDTLLDLDQVNDLIDVEGTSIDGAIGLDLDEDGFADAVLYTLEDALAEGDTVEFTGIEVDASDYADGTYSGLRELTSCSASVERDNAEPTVTVNAVEGEADFVITFSERMNEDYSDGLDDDVALEAAIDETIDSCESLNSANSQYRCSLDGATFATSAGIDFDDEVYYDYAGNELDYSDGVADFDVIDSEDYDTSIEDFTVTCESLGSGDAKVQVWAGYANDSDIDSALTALITIPFDDGDIHLLGGTGVPGLAGNDWSFTVENERGLLIPTVEADGTDVVVTIDSAYHDGDDVEWAIRQSAVGGGGLSGSWLDDALAPYGISGAGAIDAGDLGEDFTTADADTSTIEDTFEGLIVANAAALSLGIAAGAGGDAAVVAATGLNIRALMLLGFFGAGADDPTNAGERTAAITAAAALVGAGAAAGFGERNQQCLWTATLTTPLYGDSYDDLGPADGAANVSGELIVKFGSDVQEFVADDVYYDGANFISGVIIDTTDAADSPVMELNVNGSKATASAS